ncbi:MAG: hypothetical protein IJ619_03345 [Eubacterium sp.]|nr:hypothetical protein [Eubacterium sp.]
MARKETKDKFIKLMQKQEKRQAKEKEMQAAAQPDSAQKNDSSVVLAKSTKLAFFKQYYTYQAFLEIHPQNNLSIEHCLFQDHSLHHALVPQPPW